MQPLLPSRQTHELSHEAARAARRPIVFLAEDDLEMRRLIAGMLGRAGYDVIEAPDGRELKRLIGASLIWRGQVDAPDLIISDVRMPGWSGLDALAAVRLTDWSVPVVLITAFGDHETHEDARRLGAEMVIDKPFDLGDLRDVVTRMVPPGAAR